MIVEKLEKCRLKYLVHRFLVVENTHHWKIILADQSESKPIWHMDFSENLQFTPKYEVQDVHFSKRQFSQHCTVQYTGDEAKYPYHLSDELSHNINFVAAVVHDIVSKHSEKTDLFRFMSDNCGTFGHLASGHLASGGSLPEQPTRHL